MQVIHQTAASTVVVTAHEEFFGGDIGQRILFAYFQADVAAYGVHIAGISIDIVEIDINRLQILQCDFSFFAARIIADHLLVGGERLFRLVVVVVK